MKLSMSTLDTYSKVTEKRIQLRLLGHRALANTRTQVNSTRVKKVVILMKVLLDYVKIPASWRRLPVKPVKVQCIEQVSRIHL